LKLDKLKLENFKLDKFKSSSSLKKQKKIEEKDIILGLNFKVFGSIFANPPKVGTMGSPIPAKFFLVIL
jgi:hypothetical protein